MIDPRLALLVFAALVAVTLAVVWPRRGLASRLRRLVQISERVRLEDALKYLFHRGDAGEAVGTDALAGALAVSRRQARTLLDRLTDRHLALPYGSGYRLTEQGRSEALRIVRSHRLLERYLADRTGIDPEEWHEVAEAHEHLMSVGEVEALATRLGQPRYDPHGDPIPTASGELPASGWIPLPDLGPGEAGVITHLEDEPPEDFHRLVTLGFALGKPVVVRGHGSSTTEIELDGAIHALPHGLAIAVSVLGAAARPTVPPRTLASLGAGETGRVVRIASACRGAQRRRLLDLGVVPGTEIGCEMRSASGDPTAYRIRAALIALRRQQAEWIEIERETSPAPSQAA